MQFSFHVRGFSHDQYKQIGNQFCCRGPEWMAWLFKVTPMQVLVITLPPTPASSKHGALCKLGWILVKTLFRAENKGYLPGIRVGLQVGMEPFLANRSASAPGGRWRLRTGAMWLYLWRGLPTLCSLVHPFPLSCLNSPAKWHGFGGLWPFLPSGPLIHLALGWWSP